MVKLGSILLSLSALFLLRSSYELFVLTPLRGPQMVFFSLLHTWSAPAVIAFFLSWLAYYALVLYALVALVARLAVSRTVSSRFVQWLGGPPGSSWSIAVYVGTSLVLIHLLAMITYENWSRVLS